MTSLLGILLFVFALMLAIGLHEGGHFTTAKLFGMKVERFFLGFGPTLWSFRRGETEYGLKALPLGGFCKIAGMSPYESDFNFLEEDRSTRGSPTPAEATEPSRLFRNKPAWQRAIVLAAGSITHFLVALVIIYVVLVGIGIGTGRVTNEIAGTVATTSNGQPAPARAAGLRAGDRIVAVDGRQVVTFDQLRAALTDRAGKRITITYVRDGRQQTTSLTAADEGGRGFLGFRPVEETRRMGPIEAVPATGRLFWATTTAVVKGFGGFVTGLGDRLRADRGGQPAAGQGGGDGGPVGIVGITRIAGQAVASSQWAVFLAILIELNIIVGIFNLLPLPPMDGGYLAFVAWQAVTKREVDLRKVVPVAALIIGLLVMLTVGLAWLDVTNPVPDPFSP